MKFAPAASVGQRRLRVLLAAYAALAAALVTPLEGQTIKIVSSLPRIGSAKAQTDTIVNGIKMALEEAKWRAGPFAITYSDWDDATAAAGQWTAEAESANARRAIRDPDVMVYIGTYNSGAAKISMPILNEAGLLMVSPANTWPGLTKPNKGDPGEPAIYRPSGKINYVRVVPADDLQGPLGAAWARQLAVRRVYVLDDNEVYGKGIANLFADACRELGIEVLGQESIDVKALEFKSLMTSIRGRGPDLVYFGGTTQSKGGQIAKDMIAAGLRCKLMVPDACYEDSFIASAGPENVNDRCYVTFGGLPPEALTGAGKTFVDRYRKTYRSNPEVYAIYGYEAAKVALESIARAGVKDRGAIVKACLGIKSFDKGALGTWSFDDNGDTTLSTISGSIVRNGRFEFVTTLPPPGGFKRPAMAADASGPSGPSARDMFIQQCINGLTVGSLLALIALGYTMVYGIIELINFAHGDVFMLGSCLALTLVDAMGLASAGTPMVVLGLALVLVAVPAFCAGLNMAVDRVVYKPLRTAPKLAALVSAIGVSFIFMNVGLFWQGAADVAFPNVMPRHNLLGEDAVVQFTGEDLMVVALTLPVMIALTMFVKYTRLGKAMRATAQDPLAARLMGINVDRVISATFMIGGALAGVASIIYCLYIHTVSWQMGFQNGLYAFTAAVLGGIGNIPGAVLGGLLIGLVRSLGSAYVGERWTSALIFGILIVVLVFRPSGLLGSHTREKV